MRNHLQGILDANPILTLLQMKACFSEHLTEKPEVSTATIARGLGWDDDYTETSGGRS